MKKHTLNNTSLALIAGIIGPGLGCSDNGSPTDNDALGNPQVPASTSVSAGSLPSGPPLMTSAPIPSGAPSAAGTTGTGTGSASAPSAVPTAAVGGSATSGPATSASATSAPAPSSSDMGGPNPSSSGGGVGTASPPTSSTAMEEPPPFTGTCTESEDAGRNATGTGPHDVVIETNSEDGIRCGTIFRPADLGGADKYPIFLWGEGGCSQNGFSNVAAMAEIASWGYFVIADGTPNGDNACEGRQNGAAFIDYMDWAIAENDKPCSAYYESLETTKIAADGFSCGGLIAENAAGDPRLTAVGITSSGLMGANNNLWDSMHAPFKIMNGGESDVAYPNGLNDYEAISSREIPILYFSKTSAGHGGDLGQGRGEFNLVNLAWLNWQLKGDEGATGKAFLIGPTCEFCNDSGWEFMSANIE